MIRLRFGSKKPIEPKSFIILVALLFGFGLSLGMFITFLWAFFHGYQTLVTVNDYGEAWFEMIMFLVLMPFIFYGVYLSYKEC